MRQLFLLLLMISLQQTIAQTVSNLHFSQNSKQILVTYDLAGKSNHVYQVSIYCSQDGGTTWGNPLQKVSGDVGNNIKPGTGKKITWDVLKEMDNLIGDIKFKVEATPLSNCHSFTVTHKAGGVAPVTKTVTYGVVETTLSGIKKCWITQNLGADKQATFSTDATEASAGWYWQFNRKQGYKHDGNFRIPNKKWINSIDENSDWLPVNDPCTLMLGSGWRLPTKHEWEWVDLFGGWKNYYESFSSELKLHAAGFIDVSNGSLDGRGSEGNFWSSWQFSSGGGYYLYFGSGESNTDLDTGDCLMDVYNKACGFNARCLRDN